MPNPYDDRFIESEIDGPYRKEETLGEAMLAIGGGMILAWIVLAIAHALKWI